MQRMSYSLSFQNDGQHSKVNPTLNILLSLYSGSMRGTLTLWQRIDLLYNLDKLC